MLKIVGSVIDHFAILGSSNARLAFVSSPTAKHFTPSSPDLRDDVFYVVPVVHRKCHASITHVPSGGAPGISPACASRGPLAVSRRPRRSSRRHRSVHRTPLASTALPCELGVSVTYDVVGYLTGVDAYGSVLYGSMTRLRIHSTGLVPCEFVAVCRASTRTRRVSCVATKGLKGFFGRVSARTARGRRARADL